MVVVVMDMKSRGFCDAYQVMLGRCVGNRGWCGGWHGGFEVGKWERY